MPKKDVNEIAYIVAQLATSELGIGMRPRPKHGAAVELGRLGGIATAMKRTQAERKAASQKAIAARWAAKQPALNAGTSPPKHQQPRGVIRPQED